MGRKWQLQEAKAKFSEVIQRAVREGPQMVTYRGVETAVVLSIEEYRRLGGNRQSLVAYLMSGSKLDDKTLRIINDRPADTGRNLDP